jgi:starch synthase
LPLYLKKAYIDDPIFSNSKVVLSLYEDTPDTFGENLKDKIMYAGVKDTDLDLINESTGINLAKLAACHSDAIIYGSENLPQDLTDYCNNLEKPILPFNAAALEDGSYIEDYNSFYDQL